MVSYQTVKSDFFIIKPRALDVLALSIKYDIIYYIKRRKNKI